MSKGRVLLGTAAGDAMLSTKANAICIWWHYSNSNGNNNNIATRRTTNDRLISIKHFSGAGQKPKRTHTRVERERGRETRVAKGMRGLGIGIRTLAIQGRLAWLSALVLLGVHDVALAAHRLNQNQPGQAPDAGKGMLGPASRGWFAARKVSAGRRVAFFAKCVAMSGARQAGRQAGNSCT